jgi:hypothetical protein
MSITILCSESTKLTHKPLNAMIKFVEKVDFSHYAFLIDSYVYEAVSPVSRKISFSDWQKHNDVIRTYTIEVDVVQKTNLLSRVVDQLEKPYAFSQIIAILIGNIFHLPNKIEFNGKKALICSEFVARPLSEVIGWAFSVTPDHIGMDEVEAVLKKH